MEAMNGVGTVGRNALTRPAVGALSNAKNSNPQDAKCNGKRMDGVRRERQLAREKRENDRIVVGVTREEKASPQRPYTTVARAGNRVVRNHGASSSKHRHIHNR